MNPRRKKGKFKQFTEFEQERINGLQEGGFSYRSIAAYVQGNSSRAMLVWKQCTNEHRETRKTGSGWRKLTSALDDRHLLRMAVNHNTAFSRQLAACWSTGTDVLSTSSICRHLLHRGLRAADFIQKTPSYAFCCINKVMLDGFSVINCNIHWR